MNILLIILAVITIFAVARAFALTPEERTRIKRQVEDDIASKLEERNNTTTVSQMPAKEISWEYYSFNVVGMKYRTDSVKKFIDEMCGGESVELKPDRGNQYDKYAVKVLVYDDSKMKDIFVGYVPADESKEVRRLIAENPHYSCCVNEVYSDLDIDFFSMSAEIKY